MTSYPHRHSTRLQGYDYSQAGAYAVTLCIEGRLPLLGTISQGEMQRSPAGEMVATAWTRLEHSCGVEIDAFVVMPNHVHGIVMIPEVVGEDSDEGGRRRGSVPTGSRQEIRPAVARRSVAEASMRTALRSPP